MPEDEEKLCDNCGEVELVSGTLVSDKGDLITSGDFCEICDMFQSTDNFIHDDFEKQYANREELVEEIEKELKKELVPSRKHNQYAYGLARGKEIINKHGLEE